ncbi:MAG: thymidine phosphorylase [Akkermansiaceae bacterium]
MHVPTLIAKKRDGDELSNSEIEDLISGFVGESVSDYQMSAFAMAVFFQGMSAKETAAFTRAMIQSGEVFRHSVGAPVVDKHSTGGIGDKVSLVLAPLLASAGCRVPMVSGRGLGITGGTLDKLESIPGFRVNISMEEASSLLDDIGFFMMGQTDRFCPADRKLYALRDVTGTVPSIPMITASIMSKKMAESLERLVLDIKFGSGAFMKTKEQAQVLADSMTAVGDEMGVEVTALLHDMNEPTGRSVGNALEVVEALECLNGEGPEDLREIVLDLSEKVAGVSRSELEALLLEGEAKQKFHQLIKAQGGDVQSLSQLSQIHQAPVIREVLAAKTGKVVGVDAGCIGQASLELGAGRARAEDRVDMAVGFDRLVKCGEAVSQGQIVARIHARSENDARSAEVSFFDALKIS